MRALTDREREVWSSAARGQSNKLIAETLGLSISTVAEHLRRARRKLGHDPTLGALAGLSSRPRPDGGDGATASTDLRLAPLGNGPPVVSILADDLPPTAAGLTASEREVAWLAARGLSNAAIARHRGRSCRTVANQLASAYGKLGLTGRRQLRAPEREAADSSMPFRGELKKNQ